MSIFDFPSLQNKLKHSSQIESLHFAFKKYNIKNNYKNMVFTLLTF